jgi:type I restriction enzyme S subunit
MSQAENIITEHLDAWTQAIETRSSAGRGSNNKLNLVGIKKLRELILEMAVRGLLVPQDPNDEPASVLLEKITVEKAQLIKDGKIKKTKALPEINEHEKPFDLPSGWEWVRLGSVSADIHYGFTASANNKIKDVRLLRITDIQDDKVNWETVPGCEIEQKKADAYLLENNDILIARTGGTVGKSYLVKEISVRSVFASYLIRVKKLDSSYADFFKVFLGSELYWSQLRDSTSGTGQPNVNGNALKALSFAIPPLEEQKRIVAKVDELMALCDQLEGQTLDSIATHQTLVETLLNNLVNPENTVNVQQAWSLLAQNFDVLFTTEKSIDTLKQTILQLAVMGKLVPQNPNDEPASKLLERIAKEKTQLIADKKIKKSKPLPEITEAEKPFDLPNGWEWVRFGEILQISSGDGLTSKQMNENGGIPVFGGNGINGFHDKSNLAKPTLVIGRVGYYCGSIHKTPDSAWVTDNAFEVKFSETNIDIDFLYWLLKGTNLKENDNATAQPVISGRKVNPIPLALPPLNEQAKIVVKINELMTLCDQLKTQLQTAQQTQTHLAQSIAKEVLR